VLVVEAKGIWMGTESGVGPPCMGAAAEDPCLQKSREFSLCTNVPQTLVASFNESLVDVLLLGVFQDVEETQETLAVVKIMNGR